MHPPGGLPLPPLSAILLSEGQVTFVTRRHSFPQADRPVLLNLRSHQRGLALLADLPRCQVCDTLSLTTGSLLIPNPDCGSRQGPNQRASHAVVLLCVAPAGPKPQAERLASLELGLDVNPSQAAPPPDGGRMHGGCECAGTHVCHAHVPAQGIKAAEGTERPGRAHRQEGSPEPQVHARRLARRTGAGSKAPSPPPPLPTIFLYICFFFKIL